MTAGRFIYADRADPLQTQRDIDDELAFHLDQIERGLIAAGHAPAEAAALARGRFGDPRRFASECRSIVLKEQIMARRIHLSITLILAVALIAAIGVAWHMTHRARQSHHMARMEAAVATEARIRAEAALAEAQKQAALAHQARVDARARDQAKVNADGKAGSAVESDPTDPR